MESHLLVLIVNVSSVSSDLEWLLKRLTQMDQSSKEGGHLDGLEINTMYERLLMLPRSNVKAELLIILGGVCSKNHQSRDFTDLSRAISIYDDASRAASQSFVVVCQNSLATALHHRFERSGDISDLNRSIQALQDAIAMTPEKHPHMSGLLNNLGNTFLERFGLLRDVSDLSRSILVRERALLLIPQKHPNRPPLLLNLANSLLSRFECSGDVLDLDKSIELFENAALLASNKSLSMLAILQNLGNSLGSRFEQTGDLSDIDKAILAQERALAIIPNEHPDRAGLIHGLGQSLMRRFKRTSDTVDLNKLIQLHESAILLTPKEHIHRPMLLAGLGSALLARFEQTDDLSDLDRSIQLKEEALLLSPEGHSAESGLLSALGSALLSRFERKGGIHDLNKSVQLQEVALSSISDGHPKRPALLDNLGRSLMSRFERMGSLFDLNRSIQVRSDAIRLTPNNHPDKPIWLLNLGACLMLRFQRIGNLSDINKSVEVQENAIHLTSNEHPNMPSYLQSLGHALMRRFERTGHVLDIDRAIEVQEKAVLLTTNGDLAKLNYLSSLGISLCQRFRQMGDPSDMNRSIQVLEDAIPFTPSEHPYKTMVLNNIAECLITRFMKYSDRSDLTRAISYSSSAAQCLTGRLSHRFSAVKRWVTWAHHTPDQSLEASQVAMSVIPQLLSVASTIEDRHHRVKDIGRVARSAAGFAIAAGQHKTAVEWLEQGRSMIWSQILQLRSGFDELRNSHPDLANKLESLSFQLEGAGSYEMKVQEVAQAVDYHIVASQREDLLTKVRQLPGFDRFLLPKELSELLPAATKGPIVMLNVSTIRADALILLPGLDDVLEVQLPYFSLIEVIGCSEALQIALTKPVFSFDDFRDDFRNRLKGIRVPDPGMSLNREDIFAAILKMLWHGVVKPVLQVLAITVRLSTINILSAKLCRIEPDDIRVGCSSHLVVSHWSSGISSDSRVRNLPGWTSTIRLRCFILHPINHCSSQ